MAGDPFRKVQPGEAVDFSAAQWNAFVDAARAEAQRQLDRAAAQPSGFRDASIIRVRNETGRDLNRYGVVGLSSPIFVPDLTAETNAFLREVTFRGVVPTGNSKIAILLEPALQNRVVKAQVAGVIQCRLNVVNDGHGYAGPVTGNTSRLESRGFGPIEILWTETAESGYAYATGEMWAVVRLGAGRGANAAFVAPMPIPAATSPVSPGQLGCIRWYRDRTDNTYKPSTDNDVVLNWATTTFPANRLFIASDVDGDWVATFLLCNAGSTEPYD